MTITPFALAMTVFPRGLAVLDTLLDKAAAHAGDTLMTARLAPDMLPLTGQVHIASDTAKRSIARLIGMEAPAFPDDETTIAMLKDRIARTQSFIAQHKDAAPMPEDGTVTMKFGPSEVTFTPGDYMTSFAMPNFYFHITTAYDILRHNGVKLGKRDFIGPV